MKIIKLQTTYFFNNEILEQNNNENKFHKSSPTINVSNKNTTSQGVFNDDGSLNTAHPLYNHFSNEAIEIYNNYLQGYSEQKL